MTRCCICRRRATHFSSRSSWLRLLLNAGRELPNKSLEDNGGLAGSWVVVSVLMRWGFRAVPQLCIRGNTERPVA